jgi:hypothetical protein
VVLHPGTVPVSCQLPVVLAAAAGGTVPTTVVQAESMSVGQVSACLEGLQGLSSEVVAELRSRVEEEEIDGEVLCSLTEADMEEVLGLRKFGHRRKLSHLIASLVAQPPAAPMAASSSAGARREEAAAGPPPRQIEPLDGRLLLFWSDGRTPHEVRAVSVGTRPSTACGRCSANAILSGRRLYGSCGVAANRCRQSAAAPPRSGWLCHAGTTISLRAMPPLRERPLKAAQVPATP